MEIPLALEDSVEELAPKMLFRNIKDATASMNSGQTGVRRRSPQWGKT